MPGKTPLKYIGFAIAVVGAIVWNRAPNDLILLVGILLTLGGVSVFGVQFELLTLGRGRTPGATLDDHASGG
jgi:hypothetical protein